MTDRQRFIPIGGKDRGVVGVLVRRDTESHSRRLKPPKEGLPNEHHLTTQVATPPPCNDRRPRARGVRRSGYSSARYHRVDGVRAEIKQGTLEVKGSDRADTVALRLKAGDPNTVQVDVGDDGSADFSFARSDLSAINVKMGDGNDSVRVDDANGAFTDSIPTTIAGGDGNDSLNGGPVRSGAETIPRAATATIRSPAEKATTPPTSARKRHASAGILAMAAT